MSAEPLQTDLFGQISEQDMSGTPSLTPLAWSGETKSTHVSWQVLEGDCATVLPSLADNSFHCVITSPPYYWQRDYDVDGQIGQEQYISDYVNAIVARMDEVRRVLRNDGTLFLNLGDTYYSAKGQPKGSDKKNGARRFGLRAVDTSGLGVPRKTAIGILWRVAIEMISRGWILRAPIIWQRSASLPEPSAVDRPWRTYELLFLFAKSPRYFFKRGELEGEEDIWRISARPNHARGVHSAAFPEELVKRCLAVGCPSGGTVLDPFAGSGTVLQVAAKRSCHSVGIDLKREYCEYMINSLMRI